MIDNTNITPDKKLTVIFRIESGCLGPEGKSHIVEFCNFAQNVIKLDKSNFLHWKIVPRIDKTLPEIEYKLRDKILPHDKAARYLTLFKENIDTFEDRLNEKLMNLIDDYFQTK